MREDLRIGISRCLLGDPVRHDGAVVDAADLVAWLGARVELWPICPEVEIGMPTPRELLELQVSPNGVPSGAHRVRLVGVETGTSWTTRMHDWAARHAGKWAAAGISGVVLKAGSPSCGAGGVPVHSGTLRLSGRGLFAQAVATALPDIPMVEESELERVVAREAFLAAVRARRVR